MIFPSEGQVVPFSPDSGSLVVMVHYSKVGVFTLAKVDYIKSLLRKNYGEIRMCPHRDVPTKI